MRLLIITIILTVFNPAGGKQDNSGLLKFTNHIFNSKIKTVQLYRAGWNLSYPTMKLNSPDKLVLHFDLLDDQPETYYYTFIHCDKDWNISDILPGSYLNGYAENSIDECVASFNTTVNYHHYMLSFPNDKVSLTISGNYILVIYPQENPEEPAITQRFIVTEDAVKIDATIRRPLMLQEYNTNQQVGFTVNYTGIKLNDPSRNVYAFILQNGRWDNARKDLKPDIYGNNELKYNTLSNRNIFRGGNEYRNFDIKSIKHQTEFVKKIDFAIPSYNVYLYPSDNREFKPYFYRKDFNGKYYVAIQEGKKPETDADYVYVYFTLPSKQIIPGGKIYVSGGLNNWSFDKNNMMTYNQEREEYECTMLLKQGLYNYEYVFLKEGGSDGTASLFEGSHYETENDYLILIYYRNPLDRYDRVIGTFVANTLNRISN